MRILVFAQCRMLYHIVLMRSSFLMRSDEIDGDQMLRIRNIQRLNEE